MLIIPQLLEEIDIGSWGRPMLTLDLLLFPLLFVVIWTEASKFTSRI